jgi:YVTN family beta-propeller protein
MTNRQQAGTTCVVAFPRVYSHNALDAEKEGLVPNLGQEKAGMVLPRFVLFILMAAGFLNFAASAHAGSSNSLMDVSPDGTRLLVANPDNGTVTVVDTVARKNLREIQVGEKPEGVTWIGPSPLAAATIYHEDTVVFFNTENGRIVKKLVVPDEPYGIVTNKDGTRAWVTHEYPGLVSEIDLAEQKVTRQLAVGPFVRGLALSPDENRLYVTEFYSAILRAVDLKEWKVVDSWTGHSTDNLCRNVVLHPRRPKAYLSHIRSKIDVIDSSGSIFPHLSICDLAPASGGSDLQPGAVTRSKRRTSMALDTYNGVYVVTNPWESAISPDGKTLYTIYAGTNDMNISKVIDDDYQEISRAGPAMQLGRNPRAIRLSSDGQIAYVYNALDFAVTVHQASDMKRLATIKVCDPPKSPEWVRGKILFNSSLPPMTSRRWIACSSCHPDGHTDGRVWQNPEGLRKTTALFGLAHTHPLHWSADRDEVQDFEYTIRGRLMQGGGLLKGALKSKPGFEAAELEETLAGRSPDLDALAVYCNSFDFALSPHIPAAGKLSEAAERGKALFFSQEVGCARCHSGPYYTDSRLQKPFNLHDIGTGDDPTEKIGPKYDTPTLLGVYRSAPYLHHGKAATLMDVLTTSNKEDKHGKTSHFRTSEIDDLVEFLKSLPYEPPPTETPNTVKYRFTTKTQSAQREEQKK